MASSLRSAHSRLYILDNSGGDRARTLDSLGWISERLTGCHRQKWKTPGLDGLFNKCLISIGMLLLVLQSALAIKDEGSYESSGIPALSKDSAVLAGPAHLLARLLLEEEPFSVLHTDSPGAAESTREKPAFSSILTMSASTFKRPQTLVQSQPSPVITGNDNQTNQWPSEDTSRRTKSWSSAPTATIILSSSTGLTPSMHINTLFPPQPASRSEFTAPLLSTLSDASSAPKNFVSESLSSSLLSSSSSSSYALVTVTPFYNLPNPIQLSTPLRVSAGYFQWNTLSLSVEHPSLSSGFFGPSPFAKKLTNAISSTPGFTKNGILKGATQRFGKSSIQSKGTDSIETTSQDFFIASKKTKKDPSIIWSKAKQEHISSTYDTTDGTTTTTPITSLLPFPVHLSTVSRDSFTKPLASFGNRVVHTVSSSEMATVTLPSASVSYLNQGALATKDEHTLRVSDSAHSPMSMVTDARPTYRDIIVSFNALHIHLGSGEVISKAMISIPSNSETMVSQVALSRNDIHATEYSVPTSRMPAITARMSVSLPVSYNASQAMLVPVTSLPHKTLKDKLQTNSVKNRTNLYHVMKPDKMAAFSQTSTGVSFSSEVSYERTTAETTFLSNQPPPPSNGASALAVFTSTPVTMTDSEGLQARSPGSFIPPLIDSLTSERVNRSGLLLLTSVPSGSVPAAPGNQTQVMPSQTLPGSSPVSINPSSMGVEFISLTTTQRSRSVSGQATYDSLILSSQSSSFPNKSVTLSFLPFRRFPTDALPISESSDDETLIPKMPMSTDISASPSQSITPASFKAMAVVSKGFFPSSPLQFILKSAEFLKSTSGNFLSQTAHTSVSGYRETLTGNSTQLAHVPTNSKVLKPKASKAATSDLSIFTQTTASASSTTMPHKLSAFQSYLYTGKLSYPANKARDQTMAQSVTVNARVGSIFPSKDSSYSEIANGTNSSPATAPGSIKDIWLSSNPIIIIPSSTHRQTLHMYNLETHPPSTGPAIASTTEETFDVTLSIATSGVYFFSELDTMSTDTKLNSPANFVLKEPYTKSAYSLRKYFITTLTKAADLGISSSIVTAIPTAKPILIVEYSTFRHPERASLPSIWSIYSSLPRLTSSSENDTNKGVKTKVDTTLIPDMKAQNTITSNTEIMLDTQSTSGVPLFRWGGHVSSLANTFSNHLRSATVLTRVSSTQGNENAFLPEDTHQLYLNNASNIHITTPLQEPVFVSRATQTSVFISLSSVNSRAGHLHSETLSSTVAPIFTLTSLFTPSTVSQFPTESTSSLISSPQLSQTASVLLSPFDATLYAPPSPSNVTSSATSMPSSVMPSTSMMSSFLTTNSFPSVVTEESTLNDLSTAPVSSLLVSRETDTSPAKNETSLPTSHTRNATTFEQADNSSTPVVSTIIVNTTQEILKNITLQLTTVTMTTVALTTEVARTTTTTTTTTMQPTSTTQMTVNATIIKVMTTDETTTTTSRTSTSPLTSTSSTSTQSPKITTPTTGIHTTSTTEAPLLECNITEKIWVKTVLSIHLRRNRLDNALKQNLPKGLTQVLKRAFNDSSVHAKVQTLTSSSIVTVGYYVASGSVVYAPAVVVETLGAYGVDKFLADIRQFVPAVLSLSTAVAPWEPSPAISLQLKTVLRFVAPGDDIRSCSFAQRMEKRLENAFAEAESKILNSHSRLSVHILSSLKSLGSPAVSLTYVVRNGSATLNGTISSNLLNQLTTELVGYFLFFPPLIIAEPLEYHNLNTSTATRDYWVITVIQDVDNSSLEGNYQSFASLMEQRLAELFVVAHREGTRFRRATTVGSYTVQMVSIRRVSGPKSPAEMTYYVQLNGVPLSGTSAAKILTTVDSQTMALTLGYFVQLQAEPVVKDPPNNLWIIAAVLAPIGVVTVIIIIIIITAVLCRKNKSDFKADALGNINPRTKPVQGFDYAKQHLGQQGGDEEALPVTQETMILPLPIRDASLSQERGMYQDGSTSKKTLSSETRKSRLPSEDGSVISNESGKLNSGRGSSVQKVPPQHKMTKEEARKRTDPYDTSCGSLQLISVKSMAAPPSYSHPASSDRSQDSAVLNGEVNMALKQKSDIEHYRNKLRLKAKRKGYYDFPAIDSGGNSYALRQRHAQESAQLDLDKALEPDEDKASTYVKSKRRHSQMGTPAYRSRQSLNSPGPGGTEMDLLVMRERSGRGIRNSGYDTEPELIEETIVDRIVDTGGYVSRRQVKVHSETSTLSSQPSIDEVRQQMHLLLEEAFNLASAVYSTGEHHHHYHYQHHGPCSPGQPIPYSDVVTSTPGTTNRPRGGLQWVPSCGLDMYQCSPPKPAIRFTQLPDMAMGSPPPPIPPRTGPLGTSLRRSSSDIGPNSRTSECSVPEMQSQHNSDPYVPLTRVPLPPLTADQPLSHFSGNPITAVYAIPASRVGYPGYFTPTPASSYRSPSWMSYPPEPEDLPHQWADSVPLPGCTEAFPHPRYPQSSPARLLHQYSLGSSVHGIPDQPSTVASQQSLTDPVERPGTSLASVSTAALVKAIREEVAKLAKRQTDMFEFQV